MVRMAIFLIHALGPVSSTSCNKGTRFSFLVVLAPNPASGFFPPTLFSVTILILAGSTAAGPQGVEVDHFNLQMKKLGVWIWSTPALDGLMLKTCGSYPCCGHWSFECCVDSKIWCSSVHLFTVFDQECCTGQQSPLFRNAIFHLVKVPLGVLCLSELHFLWNQCCLSCAIHFFSCQTWRCMHG